MRNWANGATCDEPSSDEHSLLALIGLLTATVGQSDWLTGIPGKWPAECNESLAALMPIIYRPQENSSAGLLRALRQFTLFSIDIFLQKAPASEGVKLH